MPVPVAIIAAGSSIARATRNAARGYHSSSTRSTEKAERLKYSIDFFLVLGLCFGKDLIDPLIGMLFASSFTVVLLPIGILAAIAQFIYATFLLFLIQLYFFAHSSRTASTSKRRVLVGMLRMLISVLIVFIGSIPGVSGVAPEATSGFLLLFRLENFSRGYGFIGQGGIMGTIMKTSSKFRI